MESTSQRSCPNEPLMFSCHINFPAISIRWQHPAFGELTFLSTFAVEGEISNTSDGRVIANLTLQQGDGGGLFSLSSNLTILPPLNNLNNTTFNNTNITCIGNNGLSRVESGVAPIMLQGEELTECFIVNDMIIYIVSVYVCIPYRCPFSS